MTAKHIVPQAAHHVGDAALAAVRIVGHAREVEDGASALVDVVMTWPQVAK